MSAEPDYSLVCSGCGVWHKSGCGHTEHWPVRNQGATTRWVRAVPQRPTVRDRRSAMADCELNCPCEPLHEQLRERERALDRLRAKYWDVLHAWAADTGEGGE